MNEFITRSVRFRIASVHDAEWKDFMEVLHACWRQSTDCYNYTIRELIIQDNPRLPGQTKIPKMPAREGESIYKVCAPLFPDLPTATVSCIVEDAKTYYSQHRKFFWRGTENLPLKKYPAPFPFHNERWTPFLLQGQRPAIQLSTGQPVKKKNGQDWTLILSGGERYRYQLNSFKQVLEGKAKKGELHIYRQRANEGDNRSGFTRSAPGGGQKVRYNVMASFAVTMPREAPREASGCLVLKTDPEAFWVAEHDGRVARPWILNADDLGRWLGRAREWQGNHSTYLQRISEDMKLERRVHVGKRQQMKDNLDKRCIKHKRRIKTWIDQACAQIALYCVRQKIAGVMYDDTNKDYCPQFPWYQLRTSLKNRLEKDGIHCGGTLCLAQEEVLEEIVSE